MSAFSGTTFNLIDNQLSVDGAAPITVDTSSALTLTASAANATFAVKNFSGTLTLAGVSGGDTFSITADPTRAADISLQESGGGTNRVFVSAPDNMTAALTASNKGVATASTTVSLNAAITSLGVSGGLGVPGGGDSLTVNGTSNADDFTLSGLSVTEGSFPIAYSNFASMSVNGAGGSDSFTVNGTNLPTAIAAGPNGSGSDVVSFTINANNVPLAVSGGKGSDTFVVNSNSGPLTLTGGQKSDFFVVNSSSALTTISGGTGTNSLLVNSDSASLTYNGAGTQNAVHVAGTAAPLTLNGSNLTSAVDSYTIGQATAPITVNAGRGASTVTVSAPLLNTLNVVGGGKSTDLVFNGSAEFDNFSISAASISGVGATVSYSKLTSLTVNGVASDDTFLVADTSAPTTLNGSASDDTFNIQGDSNRVTVNTGTGESTVNIGSKQPFTGSKLDNIKGGVSVVGDGSDHLNIDDSASIGSKTGVLSDSALTGLGLGASINYGNIATLNLKLGSAADNLSIISTASITDTNVNTGAGANTVTVGSHGSSLGGVLNEIAGPLTITGSGSDTFVFDDSGNLVHKTGTLTATTLAGLSPATINFTGDSNLTVNLGAGGNTFTIQSTAPGSNTTVNGGGGDDTITLQADSGPTTINTGNGTDSVAVLLIRAATTINTGSGSDTVVAGTLAPALGGTLDGILAPLTVNGGGSTTFDIDDSGASAALAVTVTSSTVNVAAVLTISYSGLSNLHLLLGSGGNTLTVAGTSVATTTTIDTGSGNDAINVQATGGPTVINAGAGTNAFSVGSNAPSGGGILAGIQGALTLNGGGSDSLTLDDSGNPVQTSGTLGATGLTGLGTGGISYNGISTLTLNLGSADDSLVVTGTPSGVMTTINGGIGADAIAIQATAGPTTYNAATGGSADTITVGSNAPSLGGKLAGIAGALTINGNGSDTLIADDSGDTGDVGTLTPTKISGLSPADITYNHIGQLTVQNGNGGKFTVLNSNSATPTSIVGNGNGTIAIQADSSAISVSGVSGDSIVIGSLAPATGGTLAAIANPVTVSGDGTVLLTIDDSADSTSRTAGISNNSVAISGSPAFTYSGLANLNVLLGTAANIVNVTGTATGTQATVNTGGSHATGTQHNVVVVGSLAPSTGGALANIAGPLSLIGNGKDQVTLDDSGATSAATGSLSDTALSGLGTAGISYSGAAILNVLLGAGGDTFTITATNAATTTTVNGGAGNDTITLQSDAGTTTINSGEGNDTVNVQKVAGITTVNTGTGTDTVSVGDAAPDGNSTLAFITKPLMITGGGNTTLNLFDAADTVGRTAMLTSATVTGLSPAAIMYATIKSLNITLGTGNNSFAVNSTSAGTTTTVTGGPGNDSFSISDPVPGIVAHLAGPIYFIGGGGADSLKVDDSTDAAARTVGLTATQITGLGTLIGFSQIPSLTLKLGSGNDTLNATDTDPAVVTSVDGGSGTDTAHLNYSADYAGNTTLTAFEHTTLSVAGNFTGTLSVPSLDSGSIGGDFTGSITSTGKLTALTLGGTDRGSITAGSIGTISGANLTPDANGLVFSATQAGVLRQLKAIAADNISGATGVSFKALYDGSTSSDPQIAARVTNAAGLANRFDLVLTSSSINARFNLSRIDTVGGVAGGLRNITVEGNIGPSITSPQATYLGLASGTVGGVFLPLDNLAAVAARDNLYANTIRINSIEGIAFSNLVDSSNKSHAASSMTSESSEDLLVTVLPKNTTTKKFIGIIALPTETLRVVFSEKANVALFIDGTEGNDDGPNDPNTAGGGDFEEHGLIFADQMADSKPITALASFTSVASTHRSTTNTLAFIGDGGSVDSVSAINNIVSTGPLGDLLLRDEAAPTGTGLASVTAPSIFGNIDLFGANLVGTIQTTGVRIDPATGATSSVPADLGKLLTDSKGNPTGVTTIHVGMPVGSQIISRGNLISKVNVVGALNGTIAAQGDLGAIKRATNGSAVLDSSKHLTRFGGIAAGTSTSTSGGNIIINGNTFGDIVITGNLAGRIGVKGNAVSGLPTTRTGILGNLTVAGTTTATGAIVSGGGVGDSIGGTILSLKTLSGFIAAKGAISLAKGVALNAREQQNQSGANGSAIDAIWTDGGTSLNFDQSPLDLAGLTLIASDLQALTLTGTTLSGTTP